MATADLTAERLRELLDYNPITGIFTKPTTSTYIGYRVQSVGSIAKNGYVIICLDGGRHRAHRLAWLHTHGEWPKDQIDHIDGNRSNNAIANLRDVTNAINGQNIRTANHDSISGLLGVCKAPRGRWIASISINRKSTYLGIYSTPELAHEAYLAAKRTMHPGCTL